MDDPEDLRSRLAALHPELLIDPYFAGGASFDPARGKMGLGFHVMWPQIGEIHDQHLGGSQGAFFKGDQKPKLETASPRNYEPKKKKPQI